MSGQAAISAISEGGNDLQIKVFLDHDIQRHVLDMVRPEKLFESSGKRARRATGPAMRKPVHVRSYLTEKPEKESNAAQETHIAPIDIDTRPKVRKPKETTSRKRRKKHPPLLDHVLHDEGGGIFLDSDDDGTDTEKIEEIPLDGTVTPITGRSTPAPTPIPTTTPEKGKQKKAAKSPKKKSKEAIGLSHHQDAYFTAMSMTTKTSNNTLADLAILDDIALERCLNSVKESEAVVDAKNALQNMYRSLFSRWKSELQCGFSILFYGVGSKISLLEGFAADSFGDGIVVTADGLSPGVSIKSISNAIYNVLVEVDPAKRASMTEATFSSNVSMTDQIEFIRSMLSNAENGAVDVVSRRNQSHRPGKTETKTPPRVYLLVHSIDSRSLCSHAAQNTLARLADLDNLHLIATINHINAGLLWDIRLTSLFKFAHHDITTYEQYRKETSFRQDVRLLGSRGDLGTTGILFVLSSLTSNARRVFKILAKHQIENRGEGLSFYDFHRRCRDEFLVSSDSAFRALLTEFRDHKIMKTVNPWQSVGGNDAATAGGDTIVIPVTESSLNQILNQMQVD